MIERERSENSGRKVTAVTNDAHDQADIKSFQSICNNAKNKFDKNGKIFYSGLEISLEIKNQLPKIDSILIKAINNIPKILPATKTNIGVQVSASFDLPLILKTN